MTGVLSRMGLSPATFAEHLLLLQDISPTSPGAIDPPLWSVALECQIYVLFPALVWLWRRYHPVFITVVVTLLSCLAAVALIPTAVGRTPGYLISSFAPQFVGLFATGMLAATWLMRSRAQADRLRWAWTVGALVCASVVVLIVGHVGVRVGIVALDPLVGLAALCVLLAASRPGIICAVLEWRPLVWIGGFSYSLYLIHAPLVQLLWQYVLRPLHLSDTATYLLLLLIGGPLIVLAAWGFYWVAERPFLNSRTSATTGGAYFVYVRTSGEIETFAREREKGAHGQEAR